MKRIIVLTAIIFYSLFHSSVFAKPSKQAIDQIVAIVNDDVVTRSELTLALNTIKSQISHETFSAPSDAAMQKQVLDQLINKKLQLQIAKQTGINIDEDEVDSTIKKVASQNNLTVEELYDRLKQDGMSTVAYRKEVREQVTIQRLQQQEVVNHISITPQEVNSFMQSNAWKANTAKEYRINDILIPVSDTPSTTELKGAKTRAEAIMAKLNSGKKFSEVARAESSGAQALQGGDLGWRKLPEIPSAFAEDIAHMQPKQIAGPIQTPNGFHIIQLMDSRALSGEQVINDRKQIEQLLLQRKFEEAMQNWVSKIRGQSFIETKILA